jgi:dolichol-phosphate mannosyltransferase
MNKDNSKNNSAPPKITVVVPVYKEERGIRPFLSRLEAVMNRMGVPYEVIFSLDPSPDRTEEIIIEEINRNQAIKLLVFSRRFATRLTMAGYYGKRRNVCHH